MRSQPETTGRSSKLKIILGVVLLAALVGYGGQAMGWWGAKDDGQLKLYGNVEIREVQLGFRVGGRIAELLVDEGEQVIPGQILARLDTRPLQDQLAQAEARLAAASATVARDANGSRPQELREAQAQLADAEATLGESQRLHERRSALLAKGFISKADHQSSEAGVTAARARVDAAKAALSLAQEGTRSEDRAVTEAGREAVLAQRRAVQTDISDTDLRASEPGQVLTRAQETGAIVQPGQTVLTLALTQPVRVRAYVAEPDLPRVKPGMAVTVTVDGSSQQWPATIGFIASVAEFTPKTVQTTQLRTDLVYRMRLNVNDPKGVLRQGQPVTVILPDTKR